MYIYIYFLSFFLLREKRNVFERRKLDVELGMHPSIYPILDRIGVLSRNVLDFFVS